MRRFLILLEKASFHYAFKSAAPARSRQLPEGRRRDAAGTVVTVGGQTVPAGITVEGDASSSLPDRAADWTSCSLPITITKGPWKNGPHQAAALAAECRLRAAAEAGNAEGAYRSTRSAGSPGRAGSSEREFVVSILSNDVERASDRTAVSIYEKLTSVYVHLKAMRRARRCRPAPEVLGFDRPGHQPAVPAGGEGHAPESGADAAVSLAGNFTTNDVIVTNAVGTQKSDFYLFYAPSFTGLNDDIMIT